MRISEEDSGKECVTQVIISNNHFGDIPEIDLMSGEKQ